MIFECKNELETSVCKRKVNAVLDCSPSSQCIFESCKKLAFFERFNCREYCKVCNWKSVQRFQDTETPILTTKLIEVAAILLSVIVFLVLVTAYLVGQRKKICCYSKKTPVIKSVKIRHTSKAEKLHPIQTSVTS